MKKIISVNAGSSSLKFKLFEMPSAKVLTSGLAERIGLNDGIFTINVNGEKISKTLDIPNHDIAVKLLLEALIEHKIISDFSELAGAGHRVVQGGSYFNKSVLADDYAISKVEELQELAPLHNPANLSCYRAFNKALPNAKHVFVFDTAFHQSMTRESYIYPVPYEWYEKYQIRRYGAHGTSHQYVAYRSAEILNKDINKFNVITLHLGNGASITAVKNGKCINTSMGFTPLGGIMMGTRSGDLDPSVVFYMAKKLNASPSDMDVYLNKKSGMLGISGISSDARDIQKAVDEGNERAILTQEIYVNRVINVVGGYFAQLGRVDALVFTAGLGENDTILREKILDGLKEAMGLEFDRELNAKTRSKEQIISTENSKSAILICPTEEELMIAKDTYNLIK